MSKQDRQRNEIIVLGYVEALPSSSGKNIKERSGVSRLNAQRILQNISIKYCYELPHEIPVSYLQRLIATVIIIY